MHKKARPTPNLDHVIRRGLLALLLLTACGAALAVAGGAGGGGGGFDGGSDDAAGFVIELVFWILWSLPFPYNLIALAIFGGFLWFGGNKARNVSGLNRIGTMAMASTKSYTLPAEFLKRNPGFEAAVLLAKVQTAFPAIQQAWMQQDLAPVRRWISDGVWQRFNTQFTMMKQLGQSNRISDLRIHRVFIDAIEQDGSFDIAHVGIHFSAHDDFVSAKFPALDQRGPLELLEYWSFIRKSGASGKDLYHGNLCPACGAELPTDMGEVARCASCQAVSTLGDYDWVLCEITQADDYANESRRLDKSGRLTRRIREALGADSDFSVQLIEDKAANAFMQIKGAQATQRPEAMRRFVGDALFEQLSRTITGDVPFVFNRLYLNNVTLIDFYRDAGQDHLVIACKHSAQRIDISGDKLRLVDQGLYARNEILVLSRDVGAGVPKGALYAHTCPACGAPVGDTLDLKCAYCAEVLNSTRREWIVTQLLSADEYRGLADQQKAAMTTRVALKELDPIFRARDYAFNNVLMMIGIDGAITPNETAFAQALSRRMGYDAKKIAGLFELARNRQLALRLPEDRKTAAKVLKLMEKAARADSQISAPEQALLDEVRQRVGAMPA
jgi:hypothetical protein